eukprot:2622169-Pleurochrysis_carterae.AAC.7
MHRGGRTSCHVPFEQSAAANEGQLRSVTRVVGWQHEVGPQRGVSPSWMGHSERRSMCNRAVGSVSPEQSAASRRSPRRGAACSPPQTLIQSTVVQ